MSVPAVFAIGAPHYFRGHPGPLLAAIGVWIAVIVIVVIFKPKR
jgi:hypothetical protein